MIFVHLQRTLAVYIIHDDVSSASEQDVVFCSLGVRRNESCHGAEAEWMEHGVQVQAITVVT